MVEFSAFQASSARIRQGFDYWLSKLDGARLPARCAIDPAEIVQLLPHVVMVEVSRDPLDFVERVTGEAILKHSRENSMHRSWRDYPGRGPDSEIWRHFAEVVESGEPNFTSVPYVGPQRDLVEVEMVACPLSEDGRTVDRVIAFVDYLPRGI